MIELVLWYIGEEPREYDPVYMVGPRTVSADRALGRLLVGRVTHVMPHNRPAPAVVVSLGPGAEVHLVPDPEDATVFSLKAGPPTDPHAQ